MILLAMDRAPSVRRRDANGFLHVEVSNISKANVCPYYGSEIPGAEELGLDPMNVYYLYRDPEELAKAVDTFNGVPLLSEHLPVNPDLWDDEIPGEIKIGAMGTDSEFVAPYLRNSLVVWSGKSQDAIEEGRQKELSCGYRYRADMTAGETPEGLRYDGVMREIMGNHVALVFEGRAGPDVVVGDELMKLKSRTALMVSGAVTAVIRPRLAADAKVDISKALADVDGKSLAMDGAPKKVATALHKLVKPHLAADKALDLDDLVAAISTITPLALDEDKMGEDEEDEEDKGKTAEDGDPDPKDAKEAAEDEDDDDKDDKPAMDSATVKRMIADAEKRGAARVAAIEVAKRDVFPHVGELIGHDSAESIYKVALDAAGVDLKDVPKSAYKAMVAMLPKPGAQIAQDRRSVAPQGKLDKIVPNLPPLIRS